MKRLLSFAIVLALLLCASAVSESGRTAVVGAVNAEPNSYDPLNTSKVTEMHIEYQMFEPLYRIENGEIENVLMTGMEISEDGCSYTITLRDDVHFHDGSAFTANDVVFTLKAAAASPYTASYVPGITEDNVTAVDDYTVQIVLETPNAVLTSAMPSVMMLPEAYYNEVGAEGFSAAPVGTGPYMFVKHEIGDGTYLTAYPDYYGGVPEITDITYRIITDNNTILLGLQSGEIDFAELDTDYYAAASAEAALTCDISETTSLMYVYINTEREPYNNKLVRQAMAYAVDREQMVTIGASGLGTVISALQTPEMIGYSDQVPEITTDLEKAKALMQEAGYPDGFDGGKITVPQQYERVALVLQAQMAQIGITLEVNVLEGNAFVGNSMSGDFDLGMVALSLGNDLSAISQLLSPSMIDLYNFSRYNNPDIDALFETALETMDTAERSAIYAQILNIAQEDMPYIAVYAKQGLIAHVNDFVPGYHELEAGSGAMELIAKSGWNVG